MLRTLVLWAAKAELSLQKEEGLRESVTYLQEEIEEKWWRKKEVYSTGNKVFDGKC